MATAERAKHVLESGGVRLEIDPRRGGRITSFRLSGAEVLAGPEVHPDNYGSTIWTSPQSDWGWPPPAEFDDLPYDEAAAGQGTAALVGPVCPRLGVRLLKRFSVEASDGAIAIDSRIHNTSPSAAATLAPWQVSRVPARGLTFYPSGASPGGGPLAVQRLEGTTWYEHDPDVLTATGAKSFGDGAGGFVAHVQGRLLFVKRFARMPPGHPAPGHGQVEVYGNDKYVEIEVQGPYARIAPGACSPPWVVRWYVTRVPPHLEVSVGSAPLLEFASRVGSAPTS